MKTKIIITLVLLVLASISGRAAAIGTEFTYQGRLTDATGPPSGSYDFTFTLHLAATGGVPIITVTNLNTAVSNGLFTASVDFGGGIYNGNAYWISLGVRSNGTGGSFTALTPRQPLTPTPNASYATLAGTVPGGSITASKLAVDSVTVAALQNNAITAAKIANGQVVRNVNGLQDSLTLAAGANTTITPSGNTLTIAGSSDWKLGGNAGTTPGANFLGTTDNQALELRANNFRALRLEPRGAGLSPNVLGGYHENTAGNFFGTAIAGGGTSGAINSADGNYSFIGAGIGGHSGNAAVVGAVIYNSALGQASIVGSGYANTNFGLFAGIVGGSNNFVGLGAYSAFIGGGEGNRVEANLGTVSGGRFNTIQEGAGATIGGGRYNMIQASAIDATIGGGERNTIETQAFHATIGGGLLNTIETLAFYGTIGGGHQNTIQSTDGPMFGNATIGGGWINTIQTGADNSIIGGGQLNTIQTNGWSGTIGGGFGNTIQRYAAWGTIGGGERNTIQENAHSAAIGGGSLNTIQPNTLYATIPGGRDNSAADYAFAAGCRAKANNQGAFVWADSQNADFTSTTSNQFSIRASGGVRLSDDTPNLSFGAQTRQMLNLWGTKYGIGVQADTLYFRCDNFTPTNGFIWFKGGVHDGGYAQPGPGGVELMHLVDGGLYVHGTFNNTSDRHAKENFTPVEPREVLEKVVALPITRWNYKNDTATPHLGPVAQDFHAAFAVGPDDKHIATVDESGVALAAIQGLNQKVEETRAENVELKRELSEIKRLLLKLSDKKD